MEGDAVDDTKLIETCHALMDGDRGLIAMDESLPTCNKRFAKLGILQTEQMRRAYRDMIATTPDLGRSISGAILFDETIRQTTLAGVPFAQALSEVNIVPGIKVDAGSKPLAGFPGEEATEGLDGLRDRLAEYAGMGARFAKWRAVITIGEGTPTRGGITANAQALARYAALCQEAGIVPIVEPEVLMDGDHSLERCAAATTLTLHHVFDALHEQRVLLEGMILKPNMVLPASRQRTSPASSASPTPRSRSFFAPYRRPSAASPSCPAGSRRRMLRLDSTRCMHGFRTPCRGRSLSRFPVRSSSRRSKPGTARPRM